MTNNDAVQHPKHYTQGGVECIEIVGNMNMCLGAAVKYLWRYQDKENPLQDLNKALWYINYYLENINEYLPVPTDVRNQFQSRGVYDILCEFQEDTIVPGVIELIIYCDVEGARDELESFITTL